jgi:hypothetical protein
MAGLGPAIQFFLYPGVYGMNGIAETLGIILALGLFMLIGLGAAMLWRRLRSPRAEIQQALRRAGIKVAIVADGDQPPRLWTQTAGYVDDRNAEAVTKDEHAIIAGINRLFD